MSIFSTRSQLNLISAILSRYIRLPFSTDIIPGAVMEAVLAQVHHASRLNTYDFVDVVNHKERCGWQIKSTKESTPVTWKRAKIRNAEKLINASKASDEGVEELGREIINFCNEHAQKSMERYKLGKIGYARLIVHNNGHVTYFEKLLCTSDHPLLFEPREFEWRWSKQKQNLKKEQLPALHGFHKLTGKKWWAWHGLGENQLHFVGERNWWPSCDNPHAISFKFPNAEEKISLEDLMSLLEKIEIPT